MRIIAGALKGKRLSRVPGLDIRPSSDKLRESVFNILGQSIKAARVLDLFAGTGAFGIESLSRGAEFAMLIDNSKEACMLIRKNLKLCGISNKAKVVKWDISKNLNCILGLKPGFDLIFIDPPYYKELVDLSIKNLAASNSLKEKSLIVVEHTIGDRPSDKYYKVLDTRKYGKSLVTFLKNPKAL